LELETDKAVLEVPSTVSGKVIKVNAQAGSKIKVGETVFTYEGAAAESESQRPSTAESKSTPTDSDSAQSDKAITQSDKAATRSDKDVVESPSYVSSVGQSEAEAGAPQSTFTNAGPVPAAPSTRRLARELG